jgi:hypothetical protein
VGFDQHSLDIHLLAFFGQNQYLNGQPVQNQYHNAQLVQNQYHNNHQVQNQYHNGQLVQNQHHKGQIQQPDPVCPKSFIEQIYVLLSKSNYCIDIDF